MEKTQNQAHFSKISIQNVGTNLYGKNEKTTSGIELYSKTKRHSAKRQLAF
jgi:hypothetical protein